MSLHPQPGKSDPVKDEERWALERGSGTPGSGAANWDSINGLVPAFVTTQTANSSYILHHNVIHKTAMPDEDAYSLFMRSPPLKQCALQLIPEQCQYRWKFGYIAQLAWAAIGYGVGATSGIALAQSTTDNPRRTITVAGDAAFAETVNALGTVAQLGQGGIVFVMDNRVLAVEQWLIDANAYCPGAPPPEFKKLASVPQGYIWDYVKLAEGFGGRGYKVETNAELREVLDKLHEVPINPVTNKPTFTLVAVRVPAKDLPDTTRWRMNCG